MLQAEDDPKGSVLKTVVGSTVETREEHIQRCTIGADGMLEGRFGKLPMEPWRQEQGPESNEFGHRVDLVQEVPG